MFTLNQKILNLVKMMTKNADLWKFFISFYTLEKEKVIIKLWDHSEHPLKRKIWKRLIKAWHPWRCVIVPINTLKSWIWISKIGFQLQYWPFWSLILLLSYRILVLLHSWHRLWMNRFNSLFFWTGSSFPVGDGSSSLELLTKKFGSRIIDLKSFGCLIDSSVFLENHFHKNSLGLH